MTNESQHEEEKQFQLPEDVEKRFQELEKKEEEEAKSDNPSYAASAADSGQGQGQGHIEQVNSADSQQEISACFEAAIKKIDKVELDAKKKKSEIIQELAHDLEWKMPTDEIAAEIVHQLRGRVSERRIYECLEGEQYSKYKKKHRVENARKRQGRKDQAELAAEPQLKEEVAVQASGQETVLKPTHSLEENLAKTQGERSGSGIDTGTSPPQPEEGAKTININPDTTAFKPSSAIAAQHICSVNQQPVCESCSTKDAKIMELEEALKNLKTINYGTDNHIEASSAQNRSYNSFDNSELSEEEKERKSHRKCKNCEILQQKYELLQSKLQGYEEVVRTHTSIKSAKELIYRSTDGYQQFEFSVSFESLRQHMIAAFNSNSSVNRVWFTGKFNHRTGEVVDVRIGKTIDTDTLEIKQESKTAVILKDDTLDDITGD
jgi:hypothetical protein